MQTKFVQYHSDCLFLPPQLSDRGQRKQTDSGWWMQIVHLRTVHPSEDITIYWLRGVYNVIFIIIVVVYSIPYASHIQRDPRRCRELSSPLLSRYNRGT